MGKIILTEQPNRWVSTQATVGLISRISGQQNCEERSPAQVVSEA